MAAIRSIQKPWLAVSQSCLLLSTTFLIEINFPSQIIAFYCRIAFLTLIMSLETPISQGEPAFEAQNKEVMQSYLELEFELPTKKRSRYTEDLTSSVIQVETFPSSEPSLGQSPLSSESTEIPCVKFGSSTLDEGVQVDDPSPCIYWTKEPWSEENERVAWIPTLYWSFCWHLVDCQWTI